MEYEERVIGEPPVMWWLGNHFSDTSRNRKRVDKLLDVWDEADESYSDQTFELHKVWMKKTDGGWWIECGKDEVGAVKATKAVWID